MNTTTRATLTALLVPLALGATPAYAAADPQPVQPFVPGINEQPALSKAWQNWQSKGIDDYVISVRLSCFCVPAKAVRTVIRNDSTRAVTQGDRTLSARRGYSMDELFTMIREGMALDDSVTVNYSARGVPTAIAFDPSEMTADEETYYTVTLSRL